MHDANAQHPTPHEANTSIAALLAYLRDVRFDLTANFRLTFSMKEVVCGLCARPQRERIAWLAAGEGTSTSLGAFGLPRCSRSWPLAQQLRARRGPRSRSSATESPRFDADFASCVPFGPSK